MRQEQDDDDKNLLRQARKFEKELKSNQIDQEFGENQDQSEYSKYTNVLKERFRKYQEFIKVSNPLK